MLGVQIWLVLVLIYQHCILFWIDQIYYDLQQCPFESKDNETNMRFKEIKLFDKKKKKK